MQSKALGWLKAADLRRAQSEPSQCPYKYNLLVYISISETAERVEGVTHDDHHEPLHIN